MSERKTTIEVSGEVWKELNSLKNIGETFDRVLRRLLNVEASAEG